MARMKADEVAKALEEYPHLRERVENVRKTDGEPEFMKTIGNDEAALKEVNLIYPIEGPVFAHILTDKATRVQKYYLIEPRPTAEQKKKLQALMDAITKKTPEFFSETKNRLDNITEITKKVVTDKPPSAGPLAKITGGSDKVYIGEKELEVLMHTLRRDNIGYGVIDSLMNDINVEDITNRGTQVFVVHKIFGNMETDVFFDSPEIVDRFMIQLAERMDQRISAAIPVAEGALPNGARVVIIYGELVSRNGSTFSLRRPDAIPLSIIDLIEQNVLSPAAGAYLWMCIENGMSLFICGESACGKTTLLKGLGAFIKPGSKVYSIEKTPEIWVPHGNWQATLEKEGRASNADLLKASLRSRPDYIIVGQILGKEGSIVFQAMQTGHPVMSTFHGSSLGKIIQRLSGTPINIPKPFIDNLNIVVIMQNTFHGDQFIRRVTEIDELEGYFEGGGVLTRTIFLWDQHRDEHEFKGYLNSYILENKVGALKGYSDKRQIYNELDKRTEILKKMIEKRIKGYQDAYDILGGYVKFGNSRLPFFVEG